MTSEGHPRSNCEGEALTYEYCISAGPGTLVDGGEIWFEEKASYDGLKYRGAVLTDSRFLAEPYDLSNLETMFKEVRAKGHTLLIGPVGEEQSE
jgi:hypothetical protein